MAKKKSKAAKGKGRAKATKVRKSPLQKSGRSQSAAEPSGSQAPKGGSSKSARQHQGALKSLSRATSGREIDAALKRGREALGRYKRPSRRKKAAEELSNLRDIARTMKGLIASTGGASAAKKRRAKVAAIMRTLGERSKDIRKIGEPKSKKRRGRR